MIPLKKYNIKANKPHITRRIVFKEPYKYTTIAAYMSSEVPVSWECRRRLTNGDTSILFNSVVSRGNIIEAIHLGGSYDYRDTKDIILIARTAEDTEVECNIKYTMQKLLVPAGESHAWRVYSGNYDAAVRGTVDDAVNIPDDIKYTLASLRHLFDRENYDMDAILHAYSIGRIRSYISESYITSDWCAMRIREFIAANINNPRGIIVSQEAFAYLSGFNSETHATLYGIPIHIGRDLNPHTIIIF